MKFPVMIVGLLAIAQTSSAALSPFYQRTREISTLIDTTEVIEVIESKPAGSSGVIDAISLRGDVYTLTSGRCTLDAKRVYEPPTPGIVGPVNFHFEVAAKMRCR